MRLLFSCSILLHLGGLLMVRFHPLVRESVLNQTPVLFNSSCERFDQQLVAFFYIVILEIL